MPHHLLCLCSKGQFKVQVSTQVYSSLQYRTECAASPSIRLRRNQINAVSAPSSSAMRTTFKKKSRTAHLRLHGFVVQLLSPTIQPSVAPYLPIYSTNERQARQPALDPL